MTLSPSSRFALFFANVAYVYFVVHTYHLVTTWHLTFTLAYLT